MIRSSWRSFSCGLWHGRSEDIEELSRNYLMANKKGGNLLSTEK